ncbi:DUF4738 domain-containing protein [Prevotella dentasini]
MRRHLIYIAALLAVGLTACKEEKKTSDIITRIVHKPETRKGPQQLSDFKYERAIEWLGSTYTVRIRRYADRSLPMAADEDGRKYYDNRVALLILRKDGTTFFDRTFTKDDFRDFTDNQYGRHGALVGFMIDRVEGNTIYFGASVGSPDPNSDEYVPIDVAVSNNGRLSVSSATQLDTGNGQQPLRRKTELEAAEEEGM